MQVQDKGCRVGVRWVRLRELESLGRKRIWESRRLSALPPQGTRGAATGGRGRRRGQLGGAGIELLVNWAGLTAVDGSPVSSTKVALAQVLVTVLGTEERLQLKSSFISLWLRRRQDFGRASKKRKRGHAWTGNSFWWSTSTVEIFFSGLRAQSGRS